MNKDKIWLSSPHMGTAEQQYVKEAFETNWIAPVGPHLTRFEQSISDYCGVSHVAALSSGTAALHLGLQLLGVGPGDYVICQSFTFCGSANPIKYLGAHPVFVDSEEDSWNMDPRALEEALEVLSGKGLVSDASNEGAVVMDKGISRLYDRSTDIQARNDGHGVSDGNSIGKVKAIIPVQLYGMPAKMQEIRAIADRYGVPVLEDAAEALGARYKDKPCGSFGDLSVLSFNGNKMITTSGGGALLGNEEAIVQKAKFLATQARDEAPHYQHSELGYNYRLSNVCAAIGLGQMEVLDQRVAQRRANFERYKAYFQQWNEKGFDIRFQPEPQGSFSNRWLTCILVDPEKNKGLTREDIRLALKAENIESRPLWKPMHMQPLYQDELYFGGNVAERLFEIGLCLPSGSNLSEEDLGRIFECLDGVFEGR